MGFINKANSETASFTYPYLVESWLPHTGAYLYLLPHKGAFLSISYLGQDRRTQDFQKKEVLYPVQKKQKQKTRNK